VPRLNAAGPHTGPLPQPNTSGLNPGSIPWPNKNSDVRRVETPSEERTGLSESEQRPEFVPSNSSVASRGEATIKGLVTPPEERAGLTINVQYPACTSSNLSHQSGEEAVVCVESALTDTTEETIGARRVLSDAVPSTTSPSEARGEPVADKELCKGNTTNGTTVVAAENFGDPALVHEKPQSGPKNVLHERNRNETAARITKTSTKLMQKAKETQDHLGSGSESRNTKNYPQVSNKTCLVAIFVFLDTIHLKAINPFS